MTKDELLNLFNYEIDDETNTESPYGKTWNGSDWKECQ